MAAKVLWPQLELYVRKSGESWMMLLGAGAVCFGIACGLAAVIEMATKRRIG